MDIVSIVLIAVVVALAGLAAWLKKKGDAQLKNERQTVEECKIAQKRAKEEREQCETFYLSLAKELTSTLSVVLAPLQELKEQKVVSKEEAVRKEVKHIYRNSLYMNSLLEAMANAATATDNPDRYDSDKLISSLSTSDSVLVEEDAPVDIQALNREVEQEVKEEEGKEHTMLIVDDNSEMRSMLRSLFKDNYTIGEAENGQVALDKAKELQPDIILLDVMMPVMDGYTCCKEMKKDTATAHIPIIFLTAKHEEQDMLEGFSYGAEDYIPKPFNSEVLRSKINTLVTQRKRVKRLYTKSLLLKDIKGESGNSDFVNKVIDLIEKNLTDPRFSSASLAEMMAMSQPTLYRRLREQTELSIIEFIRRVRMNRSATLILSQKYGIQEVCEMVGYSDVNSFRKHFVAQFGVVPSHFSDTFEGAGK